MSPFLSKPAEVGIIQLCDSLWLFFWKDMIKHFWPIDIMNLTGIYLDQLACRDVV